MSNDSQEVAILLETLQQDILDGINGIDTMYNIIDTLIGKVNERVNTHESTIMTLDSALDKAMQAGQYDAMDYIRHEYAYEKEHEDDDSTFIDGYYGIYRISEETAEYYGWDYVYSNWETTEFLGSVNYAEAIKDIERI